MADLLIALALGLLTFLLLAPFMVFPTEWDELVYMYVSWDATPMWFILNRYVHIYLQRAFMLLAGEAIPGAWLYWRFAIGCTVASTYLLARLLSSASHFAAPLAAVAALFSASMIFTDPGVTWVDISCMMMLQFICIAGILMVRATGRRRCAAVVVFGLLMLLGFKTKETAMCGGIYLLFLGRSADGGFAWRQFGRDVGCLALGALAGGLVMTALDWSIISEPFYWIRPKTVKGFIGSVDLSQGFRRNSVSFVALLTNDATMPLLFFHVFFALAGMVGRPDDAGWRLTAAIPFGCICFLSLIMGFTPIVLLTPRYICPVLPIMAAVAAAGVCSVGHDPSRGPAMRARAGWAGALLFVVALVPAYLLVRFVAESPSAHRSGYDWSTLRAGVFVPLAVAGLMGLCFLVRRPRLWLVPAAGFLFWCAVVPGIGETANGLAVNSKLSRSVERFYPFQAFARHLSAMDEDNVLVFSANVHKQHNMLARDRNSLLWMYTVYFSRHAKWENMHFVNLDNQQGPQSPDFLLLLAAEYDKLAATAGTETIAREYDVVREPRALLVLLKRRPAPGPPPQ